MKLERDYFSLDTGQATWRDGLDLLMGEKIGRRILFYAKSPILFGQTSHIIGSLLDYDKRWLSLPRYQRQAIIAFLRAVIDEGREDLAWLRGVRDRIKELF